MSDSPPLPDKMTVIAITEPGGPLVLKPESGVRCPPPALARS
jgi:hypothetical protein